MWHFTSSNKLKKNFVHSSNFIQVLLPFCNLLSSSSSPPSFSKINKNMGCYCSWVSYWMRFSFFIQKKQRNKQNDITLCIINYSLVHRSNVLLLELLLTNLRTTVWEDIRSSYVNTKNSASSCVCAFQWLSFANQIKICYNHFLQSSSFL